MNECFNLQGKTGATCEQIGGTERRRHHITKYKGGEHIQCAIDECMSADNLKTIYDFFEFQWLSDEMANLRDSHFFYSPCINL